MTFGPELVARGSRERLAPILMTAFTTVGWPSHSCCRVTCQVKRSSTHGHRHLGGLDHDDAAQPLVLPSLYLRFGKDRAFRGTAAPAGGS